MRLPPVTIVMTTYFPPGDVGQRRLVAALESLDSWERRLRYREIVWLHIADDGSDEQFASRLRDYAVRRFPTQSSSRQERYGVGTSLNAGCLPAFKAGHVVLYAVDDWKLTAEIDLTPWVKLLIERADVAMIRLGPPHPDLTGTVIHDDDRWALRLDRHHFAFGHRPALYHSRMFDAYGTFQEDTNAFECERLYNEHFAATEGPDIWLALQHPWLALAREPELGLAAIEPRAGQGDDDDG